MEKQVRSMYFLKNLIVSVLVFLSGSYLISQNLHPITEPWTIVSPANAWSSLCYALPIAPMEVKIPLVTLSIISFGLWSNENTIIDFVDVTCIFWVITVLPASLIPQKNVLTKATNSLFVSFILLTVSFGGSDTVLNFYHLYLLEITASFLSVSAIALGYYYRKRKHFWIGSFFVISGFGYKLCLIFLNQYWGTCAFHISTAIGISVLLRLGDEIVDYNKLVLTKNTDSNIV